MFDEATYYSLLPLVFVVGFFFLCLIIFSIRTAIYGIPNRYDRDRLKQHPLIGVFFAEYWMWVISPLENFFIEKRVNPNILTAMTLLISIFSGVSISLGLMGLGGWLMLFGSTFDLIDGRIARAQGQSSKAGAFFDSVIDRYSELIIMTAFIIYYRFSIPVMIVIILTIIGTVMVSYTRARGEGLGVICELGIVQRAERALYLGLGTALDPLITAFIEPDTKTPYHFLILAVFGVLAIGTNFTAIWRLKWIYRKLEGQKDK